MENDGYRIRQLSSLVVWSMRIGWTCVGQILDLTVAVLACDLQKGLVKIYNPVSSNLEYIYSVDLFANAWADSKNYLVTING